MSKTKTKQAYENYLNELTEGSFSWDAVKEQYSHMTTEAALYRHWKNGTLGTLTRKKDPMAFNEGYNNFKRR